MKRDSSLVSCARTIGLIFCLGLSACSPGTPAQSSAAMKETASRPATLTVFAAASLTESFGEISQQFEAQHTRVTVVLNFANSQQLAQQIEDGAPADVFASANQRQMDAAIETGRIIANTSQPFASNRLVVIFPRDNPARIAQLQDLAKPGLKLVLAAREVPVGQYALDFLAKAANDPAFHLSFSEDVLQNVVSYENDVKSVLTKVALGEADAGIVFISDLSGDSAAKVGQIAIPEALNVVAVYPIATLRDSANLQLAKDFVEYVLSVEGQGILAKYGFIPLTR